MKYSYEKLQDALIEVMRGMYTSVGYDNITIGYLMECFHRKEEQEKYWRYFPYFHANGDLIIVDGDGDERYFHWDIIKEDKELYLNEQDQELKEFLYEIFVEL